MDSILIKAISSVQQSIIAYSKYITSNDTGSTGSHQAGFHIHKNAWPLFLDTAGNKGENKDRFVTIKWQDDFETNSRFIYYGTGTRNEYRLTRFGRGFPFLNDFNIGDLLIISKISDEYYEAFVLQSDEDIDGFLSELNISTTLINNIIPKQFDIQIEDQLLKCFNLYLNSLKIDFPSTFDLATNSRNCYNKVYGVTIKEIISNPDLEILNWLDSEFQLFKMIENDRYSHQIKTPFATVESLIETANTILNRRKSRAGKSLEHHLSEIFTIFGLIYDPQAVTEDKKKLDFLFPGSEAYSDLKFNRNNLFVLAAKTTCKDRWRQILNEADKVKTKHLFTLQQGISKNQLDEMYKYGVCLVVPRPYIKSYPPEYIDKILSLDSFVKSIQLSQK